MLSKHKINWNLKCGKPGCTKRPDYYLYEKDLDLGPLPTESCGEYIGAFCSKHTKQIYDKREKEIRNEPEATDEMVDRILGNIFKRWP